MELNGITVDGAGTSAVRGTFLCDNISSSGYNRTWTNTNNEILLYADNKTWKFTDLNKETVYYQCSSLDERPVVNPWDRNAGWIIPEGGYGEAPIPLLTVFINPNIVVDVEEPIVEYDEETNEKIITTVTTYTDVSTGSVRKETDVTREKIVYKAQSVERGLQSNLSVGKVYRFSFIGEFKSLGYVPKLQSVDTTEETTEEETEPATGIFKLTKVMSYLDLLTSGIDLFENLYNPLGLSRDLFEFDQANIGAGSIYELTDTVDSTKILYMPACFVDGTPDSSVEEYNRMMLITDLGYFSDVSILAELQEIIQSVLLCKFGLDSDEDSPNMNVNPPQIVTGDSTWMHVEDYNKLDAARVEIQGSDKAVQAYNELTNKLLDNDIYVDFSIVPIRKYIGRLIKISNEPEEWVRITEDNLDQYDGHAYLMCVSPTTYREINRKLLTQLDAYEDIIVNGQTGSIGQ